MRKIIFIGLCVLVFSCSNTYQEIQNTDNDYQIIPKPEKLTIAKGRFLLSTDTKIICTKSLTQEAAYLSTLLSSHLGFELAVDSSATTKGNIVLKLNATIENTEGYKLSVKYNAIVISGKTTAGIFYGIQSLRQLLPAEIENKVNHTEELTIPAVEIIDSPRYAYRGMHLDVGRHFFPVASVKKYIDLIAMHKMNTFHWHLTEDQGWRIEIKKYPKLTEIGGFRKGTAIGLAGSKNAPYTYDDVPYGGFYTQSILW
jgi:hexosaminidase